MGVEKAMVPNERRGVVVVGNALMDKVFRLSNPVIAGSGAWVIEHHDYPGGVEANVAAALRQLGVEVGAITPLGNDDEGHRVRNDLVDRGIDVRRLVFCPGQETAYCLVLVAPGADRIILGGGTTVRQMRLCPEDIAYIGEWKVCFTSAYVPVPVLDVLARLRTSERGPLLAFDLPDTFDDLESRGFRREDLDRLLPAIDLLMTNRAAALSYTGAADLEEAIRRLSVSGVRRGAVTDGINGSWLFWEGRFEFIPAFQVDSVDPTGAGDAYHAALISAWLLDGMPPPSAGKFASAAGALNCRAEGARQALPTRREIEALIQGRLSG